MKDYRISVEFVVSLRERREVNDLLLRIGRCIREAVGAGELSLHWSIEKEREE